MFVVPMALMLILVLLYVTYRNLVDTFRVLTGIPFAWTGGIIALWIRDMPFSISAAIGFVALSGVAVLDDMLLVTTIRRFAGRAWHWKKRLNCGHDPLAACVDDDAGCRRGIFPDGV